ncbi:YciI family protein [Chromobacterium vaccinii]|uniref:YciI family protein n=1 Tax=Chromobacterium vaccinii TaxID=1108595 RepID=UPI001E355B9B|nr:YciI family protein [Chromobacterium vaccinii]MCD4484044.1 YciI family protein [Chromobacterium vaccinii]
MYLLNISYIRKPAEVEAHIPSHGEWVKRHLASGNILFAGPKQSGLGGVILARSMPKAALLAILEEDSYLQHDVAEYQIIDFDIKAARKDLQTLLA